MALYLADGANSQARSMHLRTHHVLYRDRSCAHKRRRVSFGSNRSQKALRSGLNRSKLFAVKAGGFSHDEQKSEGRLRPLGDPHNSSNLRVPNDIEPFGPPVRVSGGAGERRRVASTASGRSEYDRLGFPSAGILHVFARCRGKRDYLVLKNVKSVAKMRPRSNTGSNSVRHRDLLYLIDDHA